MTPSPVSSTPVLRTALTWGGIVSGALAVIGAVVGFAVAGADGLASALAGVVVAAVFLGITAASILIANRWFGDPLYVPIFFGIVLGGWLVKIVVFIIAMLILRGQPWVEPIVFYVALVAGVLAALAVDLIVMLKLRVPTVSDTTLPTLSDTDD
jgi:hypothetical protein